uniref:Uncharacterized protein n=1 Tax=uncultured bacterium Contig224 TaxID=1393538 RepID=W0FHL6_9BACT|nr:hypothetical protein [uncultured bacterium Contig224]
MLGAGYGALVGNTVEAFKDYDAMSVVEVLAGKLYEGETAVVALVAEDEPAFDKALEKFDATIMRHDAATIAQEAQLAQQLDEEITREAYLELRAEHKAEFEKMREEQAAAIKEKIKEYSESGLAFHAGI